ncbi:PucR family transcriptional regulator [Lactiplantibacillus paraplantarum]|uniref:PucR family transcriptional regulator n=1 Tax=Lactiplantibacillus paraplantarum TaxID=60520 RepID=A0A4Q9Y6K6_9LACO|nr:PucR family transcriptional regulator [Lactiplantibacillus paraplantarum]
MQLKPLLRQLAATFEVNIDTKFTHNPEVTHVQFVDMTEALMVHRLYLQPESSQIVRLSYSWHGHRRTVGVVNLGVRLTTVIVAQNQLLKLLMTLGKCLHHDIQIQAAINQLAINAITADFDTTLAQAVRLLKNPLAIIDLNGEILTRSHTTQLNGTSIHAAVETNRVGQWLLDHGFAPDTPDFLTQVYVAEDRLSAGPMLITPLANGTEPIGYLVMPALNQPLNDQQALLINAIGQVIAGSLVKNQIMPTAESQRDRLLNLLLTERQGGTFADQFAEQHVQLPTAMVLIRCEPLADQAPMILQQRLQYLMLPRFKQVLVSTYHQQCMALISIGLAAYNQNQFKIALQQITKQADCRLIVSQHYVNPEDTFAAYTVCERTAQLKTGRGRVIFCEDQFYNLALARVNHLEILPFFINPALRLLLAYDQQNHAELLPTLDAYLHATCNLTRTAKQLYVHPNTLRNRLQHISELTGCDLRDAETCFKLAASFKLQQFLVQHQYQYRPDIPIPTQD